MLLILLISQMMVKWFPTVMIKAKLESFAYVVLDDYDDNDYY